MNKDIKIAVIGLGYVGLPLAVEFAKKFSVVGFDINQSRVDELNRGLDSTLEVEDSNLQSVLLEKSTDVNGLFLTTQKSQLENCNYYIVTVPTPTDKNNRPVLTPLVKASETVGDVLSKGDIVVYESTVYPGATEEDCVPVLEQSSGMIFNKDFFVGYSPERINPGDKEHTVTKIKKVTSGSNTEIGIKVDELYKSIIVAGTHLAPSIKIAEAAKVIENSQRDINIAFVNELAKIFSNMNIDTRAVLEAAGTKWNFLPFTPGLVGGHCIGVDPYYLAQKAQETGYNPEIILAGRRLNDGMGAWVASQVVKLMIKKGQAVRNSKILVLGITFKENCPDIRNTKAIDVISELKDYGSQVDVYDPWADNAEVKAEYGLDMVDSITGHKYDGVVLTVSHNQFKDLDLSVLSNGHNAVIYDIKGIWDKELVDGRL
ncbi:nucleotide sugar dehydrogenase [Marinifilum sp. N1E240]|uniref:nucleotide sugar dehydrogenase n=1 Tax=Marinifilum sp. N1E240 TaxID=2608082 RepID=UPI00128CA2FB|nr:nucleotide sugar dehydrogenase [Marinifilum sp. N1E240]MPQ46447.1 nucleotide sugar dehydrogenase [Marinifilum sp. N1E240]